MLSEDMNRREPPGARLHQNYVYSVEFPPYFNTLLIGPLLGTARGALEEYVAITKNRTGAMFGESIVDQVPVQVRLGESYMELRAAELITKEVLTYLHETGVAGEDLVGATRLNIIRDFAYVSRLCLSVADRLSSMMGVTGQTGHNPVQRHFRDCRTMSTHGALQWDKAMFPTGKMLFGLKTGDPMVDRELENDK
jgi:3-hydroxy-9,10-secoandrosta-1,3,5(10)-triene-9,17-dione monooxygenase